MTFASDEGLAVLERTPKVLDGMLRGTAPTLHKADEGPRTWSPFDIVAHLIHAEETNWIPRARTILEHGEARTFDPFDRFAHLVRFRDWSMDGLLDRFGEIRGSNLDTVRGWHLTEERLALRGQHPELGPVTLGQLLSTWVVHDLNHLGQAARVVAKRFSADVGPWRAYLPILTR